MPTYSDLYGEPIDVLHPTVKVYAVDDNEGLPIRHLSVSLTPGEGRMELPRGARGIPGPKGEPARPYTLMGDATTSDILDKSYGTADEGTAWRNTDTNDLHYWSGHEWVVLQDAFGAEGPQGPVSAFVDVEIAMVDEDEEPEAYLVGSAGNQSLVLRIPEKQGPKGDRGPTATIMTADDYDQSTIPSTGDVLTLQSNGKWGPGAAQAVRVYSIPSESITDTGSNWGGERDTLAIVPLDQLSYRSFIEITGHVRTNVDLLPSQISIEARLGDPASGELIARGVCQTRVGEDVVSIHPHYSEDSNPGRAVSPGSATGTVPAMHAGTSGTIYITARKATGLGVARVRSQDSQILIKRYPA